MAARRRPTEKKPVRPRASRASYPPKLPVLQLAKMFADYNPRRMSPHDFDELRYSIREYGYLQLVVVNKRTREKGWPARSSPTIVGGHQGVRASREEGLASLPIRWIDVTPIREPKVNLLLNRVNGEFLEEGVEAILRQLEEQGDPLDHTGFSKQEVEDFLAGKGARRSIDPDEARLTLRQRFLVPPFSVLDARQGYWRERKSAWIALGIESEVGRSGTSEPTPSSSGRSRAVTPRKSTALEGPLLLRSDSGRDPGYYKQKRETEKKLGRKLTTEEFQRDYYTANEGASGLSVSGTSVFDPVLCELIYRWFSPRGGRVLDPFAGGSVRGIVAAGVGRRYVGVELRSEQIAANREQAKRVLPRKGARREKPKTARRPEKTVSDPLALTPVEKVDRIWIKRDDLFSVNGVRGSKGRAILALLQGAEGATTAGNRHSPMAARVARISEHLGIPSRCHMAGSRRLTPEEHDAEDHGAELVKHKVNFLRALLSKAERDAGERGWRFVPLAGESQLYVDQTRLQAANLPKAAKRVVVPVGTGMALSAILHGLDDAKRGKLPVLGISVGMDPTKYLEKWAPANWRDRVELIRLEGDFAKSAEVLDWWGVRLDPHYEAKAAPYVEDGDVFWCVARSALEAEAEEDSETGLDDVALEGAPLPEWIEGDARDLPSLVDGDFDLVFTCPPYYDLERYSGDERDLSNATTYEDFLDLYGKILSAAADRLREHRFFAVVVGEVRAKTYQGAYRGLVPDTIRLCESAGLRYYNEAILVTTGGSLPVRVGRQFDISRKLGKTHQNVLIFAKGDWTKATQKIGPVQYGRGEDPETTIADGDLDPPSV